MDHLAKLGMNRTITRDKDDPSVAVIYWRNEEIYFKERLYNATAFLDAAEEAGILNMELVITEVVETEEPGPEMVSEPPDEVEPPMVADDDSDPEESAQDVLDELLAVSEPEFATMAASVADAPVDADWDTPLIDDLDDDEDDTDDVELPISNDTVVEDTSTEPDIDALDAMPRFDISDLDSDADADADMIDPFQADDDE